MGRGADGARIVDHKSKHRIELECVARARATIAAVSREALRPRPGFPDDRGGRGRPPQGIDHAHKGRREYVRTGRRSGLAFEHVDDAAAMIGERRAVVGLQRRQNASMHKTVHPPACSVVESPAGGPRGQCARARRKIAGGGTPGPSADSRSAQNPVMRTLNNGRPAFACLSYTCTRRSLISSARSRRCHRYRSPTNRLTSTPIARRTRKSSL